MPPPQKQPRAATETIAAAVLACFEKGPRSGNAVARETGYVQSTCARHIRVFVASGKLVKGKLGVYSLAASASAVSPVAQPVASADDRRGAGTALTGLEPLHGAAPQAPCPVCIPAKWVSAIGMKEGSYVFRCPECRTTYREGRPRRPA